MPHFFDLLKRNTHTLVRFFGTGFFSVYVFSSNNTNERGFQFHFNSNNNTNRPKVTNIFSHINCSVQSLRSLEPELKDTRRRELFVVCFFVQVFEVIKGEIMGSINCKEYKTKSVQCEGEFSVISKINQCYR